MTSHRRNHERRSLRALVVLPLALAAVSCLAAAPEPRAMKLCDALAEVGIGQPLRVQVSGIYAVGPESQVFYDPEEPVCRMDVQPATWVELTTGAGEELVHLIEENRRAYVTFEGELAASEAVPPDDPALEPTAAMMKRFQARERFGHLGGFRTRLLVDRIANVRAVPDSVPWEVRWNHPPSRTSTAPVQPRLPGYPEFARKAGVTGDVELDVAVRRGVPSVRLVSGDRMLAMEAMAWVGEWRFDAEVESSFRTRVLYRLEQRLTGADPNPKIEMHLPWQVTITAPESGW